MLLTALRGQIRLFSAGPSVSFAASDTAALKASTEFREVPQAWISTFDDIEEKKVGVLNLRPEIFRANPRLDLLHRNITWQLNYRNVQLTKQLSKAEMPGGGAKPWPQKKTGRAHVGSVRAPNFIRGGFANGVRGPRTWFYMLPDSIRLQGLCVVLTVKHAQDDLQVVESLGSLHDVDAHFMQDLAESRNWGYSVLFVNEDENVTGGLLSAVEKLPSFTVMPLYGLNCFSLLKYDTVVFSRKALHLLEERLMNQLNRAEILNKKYRYKDYKDSILKEAANEEHPTFTPFV